MTEKERMEYVEFMWDRGNIMRCSECPENSGHDSWGGVHPCGQQNCWVRIHTDLDRKEEDA